MKGANNFVYMKTIWLLPGDGLDTKSKLSTSGTPKANSCSMTPARLHLQSRWQILIIIMNYITFKKKTTTTKMHGCKYYYLALNNYMHAIYIYFILNEENWTESLHNTAVFQVQSCLRGCRTRLQCRGDNRSRSPLSLPFLPAARPALWTPTARLTPPDRCLSIHKTKKTAYHMNYAPGDLQMQSLWAGFYTISVSIVY